MIVMWGLFRTFRQANELVVALERLTLPPDSLNVLLPAAAVVSQLSAPGVPSAEPSGKPRPEPAALLAGAAAGDLVRDGGFVATGPLARPLAHAAAGHTLEEALLQDGLSPAYAKFYSQGLAGGAFLVATTVDEAQEREVVNLYRRSGVEYLAGLPVANLGKVEASASTGPQADRAKRQPPTEGQPHAGDTGQSARTRPARRHGPARKSKRDATGSHP